MKFTKSERQRIIDAYLLETGATYFCPRTFLRWLKPQREHPDWPVFFDPDEADWTPESLKVRIKVLKTPIIESRVKKIRIVKEPADVSSFRGREGDGR